MKKVLEVSLQLVVIAAVVIGADNIRSITRVATAPVEAKTTTTAAAPKAERLPWDQFIANKACENLRNGMKPHEAGEKAGIYAAKHGYYDEVAAAGDSKEKTAKLVSTLIMTCQEEIERYAS